MDYQYMNTFQINTMDYWSLVYMLMNQSTPEIRKLVLERLTEMNNQLLGSDLSRLSTLNSRKKDTSEIPHPSLDFANSQGKNPLPIHIPINSTNPNTNFIPDRPNQYSTNSYQNKIPTTRPEANIYDKHQYDVCSEIDLDDIIEEIRGSDPLDDKLAHIKKLYGKILTDKRRRRKERENKH